MPQPVSYTHLDVYKRQAVHRDFAYGITIGYDGGLVGHLADDAAVVGLALDRGVAGVVAVGEAAGFVGVAYDSADAQARRRDAGADDQVARVVAQMCIRDSVWAV